MACPVSCMKNLLYYLRSRGMCTVQAVLPELDPTTKEGIENNKIKARKHPGVIKVGTCSLPKHIVTSIQIITEEHPIKAILADAKMLTNYLFSRHYPWEEEDLSERRSGFYENVKSRLGELPEEASEEQMKHYNQIVRHSVTGLMEKYNYKWSPLDLNNYSSIVYLFTRAAPNFAAVYRVFREITYIYPDYKPNSLFDFGSGVGSVSWAAKDCWGDSLKQVMNIDSSSSMNDLAELILKGGKSEVSAPLGVYFRQFLPTQHTKHSLVVSAHSLMELPSREARLSLLLNLWAKTEHFLVIIEQGSRACFRVVVEARDFILSLSNEKTPASVLAPCPHDSPCPRLRRGPFPCHYQTNYRDLNIGQKEKILKELFSYVIIKKGNRGDSNKEEWPRVVRPILPRNNHVICRLCTHHGDLKEIIFTRSKHGKTLYNVAKRTKWGDRLPISFSADENHQNSSEVSREKLSQDKTSDDFKSI